MAAHARLKNEFTQAEKCHNLMSRLIFALFLYEALHELFSKRQYKAVNRNLLCDKGAILTYFAIHSNL